MNLAQLREYDKARPNRIHQSIPRIEEPRSEEPVGVGRSCTRYDATTVSYYCQISPTANHGACQAPWCKCPCHDDEREYYGFGFGGRLR